MKILLAVALLVWLFAAPAFASTPEHFFDSLALHPNVPQATVPTVSPPPVLTPIDPTSTIAMVAAAQANSDNLWTWTRDNLLKVGAKLDGDTLNTKNRLDALEAKAPIPGPPGAQGVQGVPGIAGIQGPQGPAGASNVPGVDPYNYLPSSNIVAITEAGVCAPVRDFSPGTAGQFADYQVIVPAAGSYRFVACIASGTTATAPWSFHFEYPVGTNIGSLSQVSISSPLNNWSVFRLVPSAPANLPAGQITVRVVFETTAFNWGGFSIQ